MPITTRPNPAVTIFMCLTAILPAVATAQDTNPICEGRYAAATEMLDSAYGKYGTLYSGGDHWHRRDNVGATIDLYRLWRGLPDHRFRDADGFGYAYDDDPLPMDGDPIHDVLQRSLTHLESDSSEVPDLRTRYVAATAADLGTTLGPSTGWWLAGQPEEELTEGELRTRRIAANAPIINWLQTVLAASDAPWAYGWVPTQQEPNTNPGFGRLAQMSQDQFTQTAGVEWKISATILSSAPLPDTDPNSQIDWPITITSCTASPADYAAHAITRLENLRLGDNLRAIDQNYFTPTLFDIAFRRKAMEAMQTGRRADLDALAALAPDNAALSWLNVARTYTSDSVDDLIAVHGDTSLDQKTLRALNALSTTGLVRFAHALQRDPAARAQIHLVAFSRLVALQRWEDAERLTVDLEAMFPDQADTIKNIVAQNLPLQVKLALTALALPNASTWLTSVSDVTSFDPDAALNLRVQSKYGVDLPSEMRDIGFLQRDLGVWLQQPDLWGAYSAMHGYTIGTLDRAYSRGVRLNSALTQAHFSFDATDTSALPFSRLIARDEISKLGANTGLARQISMVLVNWVEQSPQATGDLATVQANALSAVINLGKKNNIGNDRGQPIAERAFLLLHSRFAQTDAAEMTPYWFECSDRCES